MSTANIKKLWLSPSWFSSQKGLESCPRICFNMRTMPQYTPPPQSRTWNGGKGVKMIDPLSSLFAGYCPSGLFSLPQGKVGDGSFPLVPWQLQDRLGWGCLNYNQGWICWRFLVFDKRLQKVHLYRQWLNWKILQNNWVLKMIHIKVILPCTLLSDLILCVHVHIYVQFQCLFMFMSVFYLYSC
jgi:hypothetical protein